MYVQEEIDKIRKEIEIGIKVNGVSEGSYITLFVKCQPGFLLSVVF